MKQLVALPPFLALRLVDMLHEVGIPAETTEMQTGVMGVYPGLTPFTLTVWVLNKEDLEHAREVLEILRSQPPVMDECPDCEYDLQGHSGEDDSPECGIPIRVENVSDSPACEACGETLPSDSEAYWRCSASDIDEPVPSPGRSRLRTRKQQVGKVLLLIVLLSMVGGVLLSVVRVIFQLLG